MDKLDGKKEGGQDLEKEEWLVKRKEEELVSSYVKKQDGRLKKSD